MRRRLGRIEAGVFGNSGFLQRAKVQPDNIRIQDLSSMKYIHCIDCCLISPCVSGLTLLTLILFWRGVIVYYPRSSLYRLVKYEIQWPVCQLMSLRSMTKADGRRGVRL